MDIKKAGEKMKTKCLIVLCIISLLLISGCSEISDPCKSQFEDCNYDCGDGILSSICKEKCTYQYNNCKEGSGN